MNVRSILICGTCLPLLQLSQAQTANDATPPDTYVVSVIRSASGTAVAEKIYREGSKVVVDRFDSPQSTGSSASRTRILYDLDEHSGISWKLPDSSGGCAQSAMPGDWGDPFAGGANVTLENVKVVGQEPMHGMTATVYALPMGAKGTEKQWVHDDTGLVFKTEMTAPGGAAETILEVSDVSFRPPSTSTFALPANCTIAPSVTVLRDNDAARGSTAAPQVPVIYVGATLSNPTTATTAPSPAVAQPAPATATAAAATTTTAAATLPAAASGALNIDKPDTPVSVATANAVPPAAAVPAATTPAATPVPVPVTPAATPGATMADSAPQVAIAAAQPPAAPVLSATASVGTTSTATTSAATNQAPTAPVSTTSSAASAPATAPVPAPAAATSVAEAMLPAPAPAAQAEAAPVATASASAPGAGDDAVWAAGDPNDYAEVMEGPGSHDGCSVVLRIMKAGTMEPIVSGVQVGVGSEAFAESLQQYKQGGASQANLIRGMYAVMPSIRDGVFRIGNAPAQFTLYTSFGAAGDLRAHIGLQCFAPETTLLLVVRNPANVADGSRLFWVKSGQLAAIPDQSDARTVAGR